MDNTHYHPTDLLPIVRNTTFVCCEFSAGCTRTVFVSCRFEACEGIEELSRVGNLVDCEIFPEQTHYTTEGTMRIPMAITLIPAYGRRYTDVESAMKDWRDGKDFRILRGPYCSIRDTEKLFDMVDTIEFLWAWPDLSTRVIVHDHMEVSDASA